MMNLMTALYQQVNGAHEYSTYRTQAPKEITLPDGRKVSTPYPYAVFKLMPVSNTEKDRDDYTLEVSCWDKPEGTSDARVLQLADEIRKSIVGWRHLDGSNLIFCDRPSMGHVPDPDPMIKRYDVTTILKTYRR